MSFSPCCRRKYRKSCTCCSPCDCMNQRLQCLPSTTEDSDAPSMQLYTPVIAAKAKPANNNNNNCCCCCEVRPKKSLWQQLFGDIKCYTPNQKKKQECPCCKPKKKSKCFSESFNLTCCPEKSQINPPPTSTSKPNPSSTAKPCKTLCKKANICKCKACCPTSDSVFGCKFFYNMGNECRTKRPKHKCCCCCDPSSCSPTDTTTEDESCFKRVCKEKSHHPEIVEKNIEEPPRKTQEPIGVVKPQPRVENPQPRPEKSQPRPEKSQPRPEKPQKKPDKPSRKSSEFHIGLTITNLESKFYQNDCPPGCVKIEGGSNHDNEVNEGLSSEQIITLEIHQSDDNLDKERNGKKENDHHRDDEGKSLNSSKRRILSPLGEENESANSREIIMADQKKNGMKNNNSETGSELVRSRDKRTINTELLSEYKLDDRVSEILRRLQNIEKKINNIDIKKIEHKSYNFEMDSSSSTISLHFKDGKLYDGYEKSNHKTVNSGKNSRRPDTVIEIRKSRSQPYSPVRKESTTQITKYRNSRSLDRAQRDKTKLIIKLPREHKVNDGQVSMKSDRKMKSLDYHDSEWMEVCNELKRRKEINTPCYCYDCVCRRVSCGVY